MNRRTIITITTTIAPMYISRMMEFLQCRVAECLDSEGNRRSDGTGPYIGADGCNTCFCSNGTSVCTRMLCRPGHRR